MAKPFLKWAGSKRQLLPELIKHVPAKYGAYHEPFLGGGSLFFEVQPKKAYLSDKNRQLIRAYSGVQFCTESVIKELGELGRRWSAENAEGRKKLYADSKRLMMFPLPAVAVTASRFIFVNKTCFNGLYRTNKKGEFNTPMGKWKSPPKICDEETIRDCAKVLREATVNWYDYKVVLTARRGDFVYFDPPYWPTSKTANFTGYTSGGFTAADHEALRDVAWRLKQQGVYVLLSNADVPEVRKLYRGFEMRTVSAPRSINCKGEGRGKVRELLIW